MLHPITDVTSSVVQTLVLYSLAEHQIGHARIIRVTASGRSFVIEDDGRGHAIGRSVAGSPYLNFIYGHLNYPFEDRKTKPIQLQGLGMSLLNRLCEELLVSVRKTNATLNMQFQGGSLVSHELIEAENKLTGNKVAGKVYEGIAHLPVDEQALEQWFHVALEASKSLELFFNGQLLGPRASGA